MCTLQLSTVCPFAGQDVTPPSVCLTCACIVYELVVFCIHVALSAVQLTHAWPSVVDVHAMLVQGRTFVLWCLALAQLRACAGLDL